MVYALLERQHIFATLQREERIEGLLLNIDAVIAHFGSGIGRLAESKAEASHFSSLLVMRGHRMREADTRAGDEAEEED